jgi:hypothetical protein
MTLKKDTTASARNAPEFRSSIESSGRCGELAPKGVDVGSFKLLVIPQSGGTEHGSSSRIGSFK